MKTANLFVASLLSSAIAPVSTPPFVNETYQVTELAPGIHAFLAPPPDSSVVQGNSVLIEGARGALVVDSGQFPSLAERMVADVRKLTSKPVRYLVNSHWHFDHCGGNQTYRDAFPDLAIVGTRFTREMVARYSLIDLEAVIRDDPKLVAQLRDAVTAGRTSSGRLLGEDEKRQWARDADTLEHIQPDMERARVLPPDLAFDDALTIDLGGRTVEVLWLGRANTGGDAIVWVPDQRLLIAGDAAAYPVPFAFGSYPSEWPATLRRMIALGPTTIVPGHGPVLHGTEYLETLIELFETLTSEVEHGVEAGWTLRQAYSEVKLDELHQRLVTEPGLGERLWRTFLGPAIERAYQEATGTLAPEHE